MAKSKKIAEMKHLPRIARFLGGDSYRSCSTPENELWICPKCGQAAWCVEVHGRILHCYETEQCRNKKGYGGTRMVKATAEQKARALAHDLQLREKWLQKK